MVIERLQRVQGFLSTLAESDKKWEQSTAVSSLKTFLTYNTMTYRKETV